MAHLYFKLCELISFHTYLHSTKPIWLYLMLASALLTTAHPSYSLIISGNIARVFSFEPSIDNEKLLELFKSTIGGDVPCKSKEMQYFAKFLQRTDLHIHDNKEKLYFLSYLYDLKYCPFCGKELPKSLRHEFYRCIYMDYGREYLPDFYTTYCNPLEDRYRIKECPFPKPLPEEFKSDAWWKNRKLDTKKGYEAFERKWDKWTEEHPNSMCFVF